MRAGAITIDKHVMSTHRLLGKTVIPLHQVSRSGKLDSNFPLTGKDGSPTTVSACVHVRACMYCTCTLVVLLVYVVCFLLFAV